MRSYQKPCFECGGKTHYEDGGSFSPHEMFKGSDRRIANTYEEHLALAEQGYTHEMPQANMGMSVPGGLQLDMQQAMKQVRSMYNKKAKERDKLQKGPAAPQNFSTDEFIGERKESFLEYLQRVNEEAMAMSALESWMSAKDQLNGLPPEAIMQMGSQSDLGQAYDGGNASSYFGMGTGAGFSGSMQPWISDYRDTLAQNQRVGMNVMSSAQTLAEDIVESIYAPKVADTKTKTKLLFEGDKVIPGEEVYDKDGIYKRTKRDRIKRDWGSEERRKDKAEYRDWKKKNRPIFRQQRKDARKQKRQDEILQYQQAYYPEFFEEQNQNVQDNISAISEETKDLFKSPWAMDDNYKFGLDENFEYKPYGADMFGYGSFSNRFRYGGAYYDQFGGNVNPYLRMYNPGGKTQGEIEKAQAEADAMRAQNAQEIENIRRGNYFGPTNSLKYPGPGIVDGQQFVIPSQYGYAQDYRLAQPALFRGRMHNLRPRFGAMPMGYDPTKTYLRSEDIKVGGFLTPNRRRERRLYEQYGNAPWRQGQDVQGQDVEDAQVIEDGAQGRPSFDEIAARETEGLSRRDQRKTMRNLRRARRNDMLDYFMTPEERGEAVSPEDMEMPALATRPVELLDQPSRQMELMEMAPTPGMDAVGPNAAPATTAEAEEEEEKPAFDYSAYDARVRRYVDNGKTLDDLVKSGMGTEEGLKSRFPDLFEGSSTTKKTSTGKTTSAPKSTATKETADDSYSYANADAVYNLDPTSKYYVPKDAAAMEKLAKTHPDIHNKWRLKLGTSPLGVSRNNEWYDKQLKSEVASGEKNYKQYYADKADNPEMYEWIDGDLTPDTASTDSPWHVPKTMDDLWKLKEVNPSRFSEIMDAIREEGDTYGENDQKNLDVYYKNAKDRAIEYYNKKRIDEKYRANANRSINTQFRQYGGNSSPVYAEDYDMAQNVYIPYMDDGGNPWAVTSVRTKEKSANPVSWLRGQNKYGEARADTILDWLTNIGENRTAKRSGSFSDISGGLTPDEAMAQGMFTAGDMIANVAEDRSDETYGNWMVNRGDVFNPVTSSYPTQFTGFDYGQIGGPAVVRYGGQYKLGGPVQVNDVVELSESEIEALLKAGGQIEYL